MSQLAGSWMLVGIRGERPVYRHVRDSGIDVANQVPRWAFDWKMSRTFSWVTGLPQKLV